MSQTESQDEGFNVSIEIEPASPMGRNVFRNPTYDAEGVTDDSVSHVTGVLHGMQQQTDEGLQRPQGDSEWEAWGYDPPTQSIPLNPAFSRRDNLGTFVL